MALDKRAGEAWQHSWDLQQEGHLPDREQRFAFMTEMLAALGGSGLRVLDLACGPGSITRRVLDHLPGSEVVGVDIDPVLLAIYEACFADEPRASSMAADLERPEWSAGLAGDGPSFDAVLVATALHWLPENSLARLYADLAVLLRPGGIFCNADHAPTPAGPVLSGILKAVHEAERVPLADGREEWDGWWRRVAADPQLAPLYEERSRRFPGGHSQDFKPPAAWHLDKLATAGFSEAAVVWRRGGDAITAAVR